MKVKTKVKAGGASMNHNETLVRETVKSLQSRLARVMKLNKLLMPMVFLVTMTIASNASYAQSLRTGVWWITANGYSFSLTIQSIDAQGNLTGTWIEGSSSGQIRGFWNEAAFQITFQRLFDSDPSTIQTYKGYLFDLEGQCGFGTTYQNMAGSFQAFQGTGGRAQRNVLGWLARQPCPVP